MKLSESPDHETIKTWAAIKVEKPHILVTAPSNTAVDGLVQRYFFLSFLPVYLSLFLSYRYILSFILSYRYFFLSVFLSGISYLSFFLTGISFFFLTGISFFLYFLPVYLSFFLSYRYFFISVFLTGISFLSFFLTGISYFSFFLIGIFFFLSYRYFFLSFSIIAEGFMDGENQRYNPPILRVGRGASDPCRGFGVLLEEQVSQLMSLGKDKVQARTTEGNQQLMHLDKLRHEIRHCLRSYKADFIRKHQPPHAPPPLDDDGMVVKEEIDVETESEEDKDIVQRLLQDKMYQKMVGDMTAVLEDFQRIQKEVLRYKTILLHHDDGGGASPHGVNYELQQALEASLMDSAHIVFSTLSSSALPVFQETTPFRVVVVDEAAQGIRCGIRMWV